MYYTEGYIKEIRLEADGQYCDTKNSKRKVVIDPVEPHKVVLNDKEFTLFVDSRDDWNVPKVANNNQSPSDNKNGRVLAYLEESDAEYVVETVLGCEGISSLISLKQNHTKIRIYKDDGSMILRFMVK